MTGNAGNLPTSDLVQNTASPKQWDYKNWLFGDILKVRSRHF